MPEKLQGGTLWSDYSLGEISAPETESGEARVGDLAQEMEVDMTSWWSGCWGEQGGIKFAG